MARSARDFSLGVKSAQPTVIISEREAQQKRDDELLRQKMMRSKAQCVEPMVLASMCYQVKISGTLPVQSIEARTLATSNFQVFYTGCMRAGVPKRATQLLFAVEQLVELYAEDHGRWVEVEDAPSKEGGAEEKSKETLSEVAVDVQSNAEGKSNPSGGHETAPPRPDGKQNQITRTKSKKIRRKLDTAMFMYRLNQEAFKTKALDKDMGTAAEFLWTSTNSLEDKREFCSILNLAIRQDNPKYLVHAAVVVAGINIIRQKISGRKAQAAAAIIPKQSAKFPPGGNAWRGTGFRDRYRSFFVVGKKYRVPGFLATSFSERIARSFAFRQNSKFPTVIWNIKVDPRGRDDPIHRCKHVAYVSNTFVKGEGEYLFSPYSTFTVTSTTWSDDLKQPHLIVLEAALDNQRESERLPLAPWY